MTEQQKKPRMMHFAANYSGETLCGKNTSKVRTGYTFEVWDNPVFAGGRRCEQCGPGVEAIRAKEAP